MKLTKCTGGHVYDADKFTACPYCAGQTSDEVMQQSYLTVEGPGAPAQPAADQPSAAFTPPVAGWLVITDGPDKGKDFHLGTGRNFLGGAPGMDIALTNDPAVAPERHAIVVYDPGTRAFLAQPCETRQLFYVNGQACLAPTPLKAGDTLSLGGTKLLLVPLCGEKFGW